jgi:hypothetical protein
MLVEEEVIDIIVEVIKISEDIKLGEVQGLRQATIEYTKLGTEGETKWLNFGGTCMKENEVSRNKVKYVKKNIEENDGRDAKFFVTHSLTPVNSVGHVKFHSEGDILKYEAKARNTKAHPDIIESIQDRLVDVSVDYRFKNVIAKETEDKQINYQVEGTEIRGLCAVGVGGIASNTIDYAIAEKWQDYDKLQKLVEKKDIKIEKEEVENKKDEVLQMEATAELLEKIKQEKEELLSEKTSMEAEKVKMEAELKELKEAKELQVKAEKEATIKNLIDLNKEFKESELNVKSQSELNIMLGYEKKMKESEGAGRVPGNGRAVVEDIKSEGDSEKSFDAVENVMIEKDNGDVKLAKAGLEKFNKELIHSIYR